MSALRAAALSLACLVSTASLAAEAVFPPGSRIGLVPPKGLEASKRFTGFESPMGAKGAAITFIEMPPEAAPEVAASLTPEALKPQGFVAKGREAVKIGGADAVLVSGEQAAGGTHIRKWFLVASDPTLTAVVIAQAMQDAAVSDEDMRGALKTIALRPPLPIEDQIASLPFRLGERAGFRPVRTMAGNSLLLTDGDRDVIHNVEQPILIVAQSVGPAPAPEQRDAFARAVLTSNKTLQDFAFERSQGFRQKGDEWHEIVARAKDAVSGEPVVVTQTLRFGQGNYLRMVGIARATVRDTVLPRFRTVIDSVEEK